MYFWSRGRRKRKAVQARRTKAAVRKTGTRNGGHTNGAHKQGVPEVPGQIEAYVYLDEKNKEILIAEEQQANPAVRSFLHAMSRNKAGADFSQHLMPLNRLARVQASIDASNGGGRDDSTEMDAAKKIIKAAGEHRASDIYIISSGASCEVLFRIDGAVTKSGFAFGGEMGIRIIRVIYQTFCAQGSADATWQQTKPQSAQIKKAGVLPKGVRSMRVETGPNANGQDMTIRLLYESAGVPHTAKSTEEMLSYLGYYERQTDQISTLLRQPSGIVVISGPTGSGKSTTLKYALQGLARARPDLMIRSVEDPVEYPMENVIQTAVTNVNTEEQRGQGFVDFLRSTLRKAPDVIMIGEIRDGVTAKIAIEAAMTGHLVFTTVHTSNAWQILARLSDKLREAQMENVYSFLGDPDIMVGLMYQRLVRRLCEKCSVQLTGRDYIKLPGFVRQAIERAEFDWRDLDKYNIRIPRVGGCPACGERGTRGRIVVAEVILPTEEQCEVVRSGDIESARQRWALERPGDSVAAMAFQRVLEGVVAPQDALYATKSFRYITEEEMSSTKEVAATG